VSDCVIDARRMAHGGPTWHSLCWLELAACITRATSAWNMLCHDAIYIASCLDAANAQALNRFRANNLGASIHYPWTRHLDCNHLMCIDGWLDGDCDRPHT
jgi:hypothetical protein